MNFSSKKYFKIVLITNLIFIVVFGIGTASVITEPFLSSDIAGGLLLFGPLVGLVFNIWGVVHAIRRRPMDKYLKMGLSISVGIIFITVFLFWPVKPAPRF